MVFQGIKTNEVMIFVFKSWHSVTNYFISFRNRFMDNFTNSFEF